MGEVVDLNGTQELEKAEVELRVAGVEVAGRTTQPRRPSQTMGMPDEAVPPPLDLDLLARLSATNGVRRAIIDAIARNTVGLGYSLPQRTADPSTDNTDEEDLHQLLEALAARDKRLDAPSFTELLMAVKSDEEELGGGYLEISRNKLTGKIDGLFHAPAKRMRRRADGSGFLMLTGDLNDTVEFYNFGEKVAYDRQGRVTGKLQKGKSWSTNEILPFRLYTSESRDYGLPRDAGMLLEYAGDKLAAESNISFFDSSGTPPTIIFVQGEETNQGGRITFKVPQGTVEKIGETLKSDSGHRHRVAIVPLPSGTDVKSVQLGQISDRDMGFTEYRASNQSRQLAAFRLSPIFISAVDDSGRYTAEVQRALTLEQVFDPEQRRYEQRLQRLINDLGYGHRRILFKRLAVEADAARRDATEKAAETGDVTNREFRSAHGLPPMPEAAKSSTKITWRNEEWFSTEPGPGQVPYGWNDALITVQGPPAGADNRVPEGTSQQGLQPGTGGRARRQEKRYAED